MDAYEVHPNNTEIIQPVRQTPKWQSAFKTHIAPSKDKAILEELGDPAFIRIYSDGSGIEGNIGSAAVLYRCKDNIETKHVLCYCLGPETRHTVLYTKEKWQVKSWHKNYSAENPTASAIVSLCMSITRPQSCTPHQ
jgi:hypothetical protein